jgi:glycosyltransferase involved in cell wall biosynthesis
MSDKLVSSQPSLRIMHVVEACGGGVLEVVDTLTRGLAERGHASALAFGVRPETPGDMATRIHDSVDLIPLPWINRRPAALAAGALALPGQVSRWKPDIIHLHSSFAGAAGALVLRRSTPMVYTPHGYAFSVPRSRLAALAITSVERAVARRVSVIGTTSCSEAIEATQITRARRVIAVPNGIAELDAPGSREAWPPKERLVVAIGRPVPQRQPVAVARILQSVSAAADVAWIGGGYENDEGMKALQAAGVPTTGWVGRDQVLDTLERASVYLHWTAWDGLALSILEALARDVVVVAHDIPSTREILGHRQVCRSAEVGTELILRILGDEKFKHELLTDQRRRRSFYSAERMILAWEALYQDLHQSDTTKGA